MGIGENIKKARANKKMTQVQLAQAIGMSVNIIRLYEANKLTPKFETIKKIALGLNVNPADIDESLVINLGTDAMFEIGGEKITIPGGTPEAFVLSNMDRMTDEAKKKVAAYTEDIASNPKNLRKRNRWQTEEENK